MPGLLVQLINHGNVARTLRSGSSTELLFVPKSRTVVIDASKSRHKFCGTTCQSHLEQNCEVQLKTHLF